MILGQQLVFSCDQNGHARPGYDGNVAHGRGVEVLMGRIEMSGIDVRRPEGLRRALNGGEPVRGGAGVGFVDLSG